MIHCIHCVEVQGSVYWQIKSCKFSALTLTNATKSNIVNLHVKIGQCRTKNDRVKLQV